MTELIMQDSPRALQVPPSQIAKEIKDLAEALSQSKKDIEEIQNRNLFQSVFSNNTRDLAKAMINQGDTISGFLELVKGVIFCQIGNLSTLMALRDGLLKQRDDIDDAGKSYIDLAVSFLDEALTTSKVYSDKFELVESALSDIQRHLTEKAKVDEEQNQAIQSFEKHIEHKNQTDKYQDNKLNDLEIEIGIVSGSCKSTEKRLIEAETKFGNLLTEKAKVDDEQNKAIQSFEKHIEHKNQTDKNRDSKLNDLEIEIGNVSGSCKSIEKRLIEIDSRLDNLRDEVSKQGLYQDDFSKSTGIRFKNSILSFLLLLLFSLINTAGLIFLISKL